MDPFFYDVCDTVLHAFPSIFFLVSNIALARLDSSCCAALTHSSTADKLILLAICGECFP